MVGINIPMALPGPNGQFIGLMASANKILEGRISIYKLPKTHDHPDFNLKAFNEIFKDHPHTYGITGIEDQSVAFMCEDSSDLIKLGERLIEIGKIIKNEFEGKNGRSKNTYQYEEEK